MHVEVASIESEIAFLSLYMYLTPCLELHETLSISLGDVNRNRMQP